MATYGDFTGTYGGDGGATSSPSVPEARTTMTAGDMRDFVRTHLDVEPDELPDLVLNVFLGEGFDKVIAAFNQDAPWLHVDYTFTAEAGVQVYDLDATTGLISPTPLQAIDDVRGPRYSLRPQQHQRMRARYRTESAPSAEPNDFSLWGRSLFLWPTPATDITYHVTGTRRPSSWITSNSFPDCPEEFHRIIAMWALGKGYAQQDDPEMGQFYTQAFDAELKKLMKRWSDENDAQPLVMGGGNRGGDKWRTQSVLGPLIYEWE